MSAPSSVPMVALTLKEVEDLTLATLRASGVNETNARSVTDSVVAAEAEGVHSHGLARLPTYCAHAKVGKIDGKATPSHSRPKPGLVRVDAADGFAHPAIDLGLPTLFEAAKSQGIAALAVTNSYNCGVVGYHVERIAKAGFMALGFVNAPASIAPVGGTKPVFGTNPIAFAVPRAGEDPLVLDQSSSVIAKSELIVHDQRGEKIPLGWALDKDGQPTTDPKAGLNGGTMVPSGGHKGAGLALIVEMFAAWLTHASLSIDASSFADNVGGSPRTGQFFIAVDPGPLAGPDAGARLAHLFAAIVDQEGARLPGTRRAAARIRTAKDGVTIPKALAEKLQAIAVG
ncbi:sulfolactate dehydrogenase [Azorhizobium oxalatiphilum]|uniref:Sulfolactate dehydrogenase n=1 Tax=Azorhizobium oxalatiphilum TaxID=980631 RepID=A0A917FCP3_9HYPH|nr:Ldh family oxidoreductase [Azorhizobium oxalatiphilum]GGF62673.1 sulfolactate dehydrogenase [Azorhizobium oxalatiphilum]